MGTIYHGTAKHHFSIGEVQSAYRPILAQANKNGKERGGMAQATHALPLPLKRRGLRQAKAPSVTVAQQSAELPAIKEVRPEYHDIHSQVLQDGLTRLDKAFQAFFRRLREGQTPGYPRFQGSNRYASYTYKQFGTGATLDNGFLVLSKIGRIAVRWSRPIEGTPKTVTISREADGW
jgi:putative transposase